MATTFNASIRWQETLKTTEKNVRRNEPIEAPEWLKKHFIPNEKIRLANQRIVKWEMIWVIFASLPVLYTYFLGENINFNLFINSFSFASILTSVFNLKLKKQGFFILSTLGTCASIALLFANHILLPTSIFLGLSALLFIQINNVYSNRDFIKAQSFGTVHSVWTENERYFFLHTDLLFLLDRIHPSYWKKRLSKIYFNANKVIVYDSVGNKMYLNKSDATLKNNSLIINNDTYSLMGWDKDAKAVIRKIFSE
ncbi:hypothetical protein [Sediminitomix flava]|uniref:Uncharacterized protein n=1 Tax=Sediminitomix flava TaxID=379075 RepID=A0A316A560_SEDFL|nr:hypothetical protein [Sediminitomix flava]PWJ44897.1 hypothetical protein BC781_1011286 [Sediminitomix flava]